MVKNKMVTPNTRSGKMRSIGQRQLELLSFGTLTKIMSAASNEQIYKGYCGDDVTGDLPSIPGISDYSLKNIRDARIFFSGGSSYNLTGSTLTNIKMIGTAWCPNMAGTIRNNVEEYSVTQNCSGFTNNPVNSYITFTKDRTTTCITPLKKDENISLNSFLKYNYDGDGFFDLNLFKSVINPRYLFTNSKGKITITGITEVNVVPKTLSSNNIIYNNFIKLDTNNEKLIVENVPDDINFNFEITIKQEATDQYKEGYTSVVLEYNSFNNCNSLIDKLTFVKDRFNTKCLTPLEDNETIVINAFISYEDPNFYYYGQIGYFNPLDLSKAIFSGRYLFNKSKGNITITEGEFLEITSDEYKNYIKLDMVNKKLIFEKGFNSYSNIGFKFKITIKQEETDQTASVILEYSLSGPYPLPVCSVNDFLPNCIGAV
jgi:hypothetical protein